MKKLLLSMLVVLMMLGTSCTICASDSVDTTEADINWAIAVAKKNATAAKSVVNTSVR